MYLEIQLSRTCSSDWSLHCMQRRDVLIKNLLLYITATTHVVSTAIMVE
jgi:hypothetical protein